MGKNILRKILAAALAAPCLAFAQAYPTKPLRIIVPYPAGGIEMRDV